MLIDCEYGLMGRRLKFERGDNLSWKSVVKKNAERGRRWRPLIMNAPKII